MCYLPRGEGWWPTGGGVYLHTDFARAAAEVGLCSYLGHASAALTALEGADEGQLPQPPYQLLQRQTTVSASGN
jgi:hypothetical protein